jgi:NAD+ synthase
LAAKIIIETLRQEVLRTGINKVVLGLSGGIDSALSLYLAEKAFGKKNVIALYMPYKTSAKTSFLHAKIAADKLKIPLLVEDISLMADSYFQTHELTNLQKGNIFARLRMIVLYDYSAKENALVIGTSNKTEMLLGYSTLWGDMASAVNPIGDLFKCQIKALSSFFAVPDEIIEKAPSADLWEGQTDESELNLPYDIIDRILYHWVDLGWTPQRIKEKLIESCLNPADLDRILHMVQRSQYKRKMPIIVKVSRRTVDREFRYPRDWGT